MKWWKLYSRPKADGYAMAGAHAFMATAVMLNSHTAPPGWRTALVLILLASAARWVWKAWHLPPDPPLTH
jgi:hypothetical protein